MMSLEKNNAKAQSREGAKERKHKRRDAEVTSIIVVLCVSLVFALSVFPGRER
jgi:hypothetical protein